MNNPFVLRQEGFDARRAAKNESVFSLGNGYIGWRGNNEEGFEKPIGLDGCYINAFYETEKIRYGEIAFGYACDSQTMLNVTNSQRIRLVVDGRAFHEDMDGVSGHVRELDMEKGVMIRKADWLDENGCGVKVQSERLVSFAHQHLAAIRYSVTAQGRACKVSLHSVLDGDVTNLAGKDDPRVGSGLKGRVLSSPVIRMDEKACGMAQHTRNTGMSVACAMASRFSRNDQVQTLNTDWTIEACCECELQPGETVTLEKIVAYADGEASCEAEVLEKALFEAAEGAGIGFEKLKQEQADYMQRYWKHSGVWVEGDDELLQGMLFNLYQLLQSAGRDGKRNIAAKGLTGEGYEGHYFWDTETYIFPLFLHVAPEVARALLTYRYGLLPNARARARELSHPSGVLFPWRTISGEEASAYYPAGTAQIHINADIALAVKRYWEATGDDDFLFEMGAEIVCETARFYRGYGFYNENRSGRFCLNGVTGPDEYSALVNNNAYTNTMAAINMEFAADAVAYMQENAPESYARLAEKIGLTDGEPDSWKHAAQNIYICRDEAKNLVWQDDAFMDCVPWPISSIPKENFPLLLHYHPMEIYRHQICKQADAVLAMLMAPDRFTAEEKIAAFDYYDAVTTHDSSLSMAAFSALASRIGKKDVAYRYFRETARLDLDDTHGNTRDGLHMANMAGTWVCMTTGFGGMYVDRSGVRFDPILPDELKAYGFRVMIRNSVIDVRVDAQGAHYTLVEGDPIVIKAGGKELQLTR